MPLIKNPLTIVQQGGGGSTSDDVRFIDYDGTIIAQMSTEEAIALTELPAGPTHAGLTFDGWTHTLSQVQAGHILDVGALYVSSKNADETVFEIQPTAGQQISFTFTQDTANGVSVDWGDGSAAETYSDVGASITASHTYSATSASPLYIRVLPSSGASITAISVPSTIFGLVIIGKAPLPSSLTVTTKIIVTKKCTSTAFSLGSSSVKCVIIPDTFTSISQNGFTSDRGLEVLVIPETITALPARAISQCYSLDRLVLPESITSIAVGSSSALLQPYGLKTIYYGCAISPIPSDPARGSFLSQCYGLKKFEISRNLSGLALSSSLFLNTYSLHSLTIPKNVTELSSAFLGSTNAMKEIIFEDRANMPTMYTGTFQYHLNPLVLDFTKCTQIPTFDNGWSGADVTGITIKVPANLETAWKAASGWSAYAANIVGA